MMRLKEMFPNDYKSVYFGLMIIQ